MTSHGVQRMVRPAACMLALAASLLSGYLLWIHLTGQTAPLGCGGAEGCAEVLSGRWSRWLGVPVSVPGMALYLTILVAGCLISPRWPVRRQRRAWAVLAGCSTMAAGAAGWFVSRQIIEGRYCRFCMAIHACGALIAAWVWFSVLVRRRPGPEGIGRKAMAGSMAAGVVGMTLLIWGQTTSSNLRLWPRPRAVPAKELAAPAGIQLDDLPTLGPQQAKYRIVVMSDYTCEHCRRTHRMLEQARKHLSAGVAVVSLPVPLNATCNLFVARTDPRHLNACKLARLALAVWRADPGRFAEFEKHLFADDSPPTPADARKYAATLVGEERLVRAESDAWIGQALARGVNLYQRCGAGILPKLMIGKHVIEGEPEQVDALISAIRREWGVEVIGPESGGQPAPE